MSLNGTFDDLHRDQILMQIWFHMHWFELSVNLLGFIANLALTMILMRKKWRKRPNVCVWFLLLQTSILQAISTLYSFIRAFTLVFTSLNTESLLTISKVVGFLSDQLAIIPVQLSTISILLLLVERHFAVVNKKIISIRHILLVVVMIYIVACAFSSLIYTDTLKIAEVNKDSATAMCFAMTLLNRNA